MPSAARLGDTSSHGGTIISGCTSITTDGIAAAHIGSMHSCPIPGHGVTAIVTGSSGVISEGSGRARIGDMAACGAVIVTGSPDVNAN